MGAAAPKGVAALDRAKSRTGDLAVSGRYHRSPEKLEDYYVVDQSAVLGSGYNGQVLMATRKVAGKNGATAKFAVKPFQIMGAPKDKLDELIGECEIFLSMDHPHVARLTDVFETKTKLTLVMECIEGGEVFKRVQAKKRYAEHDAATTVWQMLLALNYLHSHGIVHRDIKLENFLYESKESDHLKLIDFGFSVAVKPNTLLHLSCGTMSYVAPEVLAHKYNTQCDLWSIGVCTFILLFGYMPFAGKEQVLAQKISEGRYTVKEDRWSKVSADAQDFVKKLLVVKPEVRLTAGKAMEHPFITKNKETSEGHVDQGIIDGLKDFAQGSAFRRAALHMMAWSLSNEERKQVREAFLEMDTDHSGAISLGEFKKVLHDHFHVDESAAEEAFHALDINHTEEIHYSEFLSAMVATRIRLHEPLLQQAFTRFDTDGSGFIEKDELKKLVGQNFEGADLGSLLAQADTDHDGRVSYDEWIGYIMHNHDEDHHEAAHDIIDTEIARGEVKVYQPLKNKKTKLEKGAELLHSLSHGVIHAVHEVSLHMHSGSHLGEKGGSEGHGKKEGAANHGDGKTGNVDQKNADEDDKTGNGDKKNANGDDKKNAKTQSCCVIC